MNKNDLPSIHLMRQILEYDANTGKLKWKKREEWTFIPRAGRSPSHMANAWNACFSGKDAFTAIAKNKYIRGSINGAGFYAHRVAWAIHFGMWPESDIDHVNGVRDDNRICNLRSVDRRENMKNRQMSSNNTSGIMGVSYSNRHKLWSAQIGDTHIGWFSSKQEAQSKRKEAELRLGYHQNHGRFPESQAKYERKT